MAIGKTKKNNKKVSKVVDDKGKPKKLYHQTDAEIEAFDTSRKGSGYYDSQTPEGIFLKTTNKDIGLKGKKQIEVYADIKNPLVVENRTALETWAKVDSQYKNAIDEANVIDKEYAARENALEEKADRLYKENYYKENGEAIWQEAENELDSLQEEWEKAVNKANRKARVRLTELIKSKGYDGVHIKNDEGSFGRNIETWIAFKSNQVKSTVPLTDEIISKLQLTVSMPDNVYAGDIDSLGKQGIVFEKNIGNGVIVYIQFDNKTRGTLQGRTFYAKKIKGSSSTENAADMKIHNAAPTFTSETIEPEPFNNSIDDKNIKINEREKTLRENIEEDAAPERQAKYREIVGRYAGEKTIGNMDKLAKRLGSEVIYYVGDTQEEGYYKDGKIYLNANLVEIERNGSAKGRDSSTTGKSPSLRMTNDFEGPSDNNFEGSAKTNYWKIFKHEFTHAIEDSKAFKKDFTDWSLASGLYSEFIKNQGFIDEEGNADKAAYADSIRELYRKNGQELDDNGLNRELMAKFVQESDLFENEDSINRLVNENRGFGQRILEWIRNTINKIKGVDPTAENMLKEAERLYTKAVRETEKKGARNSGKQSSIETNSKGKYVKESRDIPFGDIEEEWNADAGNYIYDNILNHGELNVIADDGQILTIDGQTVYKLEGRDKIKANGVERLQNADEYKRKLTMAGHIDELAQISQQENKTPVKDRKDHLIARDGFNYRKAYFEDKNGNFYRLTVSVGKNGEVQTVYNINRINQLNKKGNTAKVRGSIPETGTPQGGVSNKNVSQQNKKVNTQGNKNLKKPDTAIARAMEKAKADKRQYSFKDETESYTKSDKQRIDALGGKILNEFKKLTGAAKYEDYKELKSLAKEAAWEYAEYKDLSPETRIRLFNNLWNKAVEVDKKYYEENKEIKKLIREKLV